MSVATSVNNRLYDNWPKQTTGYTITGRRKPPVQCTNFIAGHTDYRVRTKRLPLLSVSTRITVGSSSYSFAISSSQSLSGSSVWVNLLYSLSTIRLEQQLLKLQISLVARVVEEELRIRSQNPEYHMDQNLLQDAKEHPSNSNMPPEDAENNQLGIFDRPLPCFGCGIGWFSLLLGFVFPFMWYYATILYFRNYYQRDPRERAGLAANAIAALIFSVAALVAVALIVL